MATKNKDLIDSFVLGATSGNSSSMMVRDNTLYSYGEHFPLCYRIRHNFFAFNAEYYSATTNKQQSMVRMALTKQHANVLVMDTDGIRELIRGLGSGYSPAKFTASAEDTTHTQYFNRATEALKNAFQPGDSVRRKVVLPWLRKFTKMYKELETEIERERLIQNV